MKVGEVTYSMVLPPELSRIHPTFYILMFRKFISNPSHVLQPQTVELSEDLTYEEFSVVIVDRQIHQLRTKEILMVKVLWSNFLAENCTWEIETIMWVAHLYLCNS